MDREGDWDVMECENGIGCVGGVQFAARMVIQWSYDWPMIKVGYNNLVLSINMERQYMGSREREQSPQPIIRPSMTESQQIESMLNMNDISDIIPREGNQELQAQINRLEVLLSEADKNVEMKDRQMEVLKKTCKTLENHTEMQKKRIAYLEDKVRSLENQNKTLREERPIFESSIIASSSVQSQLKEEHDKQLALLQERYEQRVAEIQEKERTIVGLRRDNDHLRGEKAQREESLAKLSNQVVNKANHYNQFQNRVKQLKQQNIFLQSKLQEQTEATVPRKDYQMLEFRYSKSNNELINIRQQLEAERKRFNEAEKKRKIIQKQLNESNSIRQTLKAKCEALQAKQDLKQDRASASGNGMKMEKQKSQQALLNPKQYRYSEVLGGQKGFLAMLESRQQKIRFLNTIILNAENQLEGLLSE